MDKHLGKVKKKGKSNKSWQEKMYSIMYRVFVIVMVSLILINMFVMKRAVVEGSSMDYTLHNSQKILYWRTNKFVQPKRFDIVIIGAPDGGKEDYVKRVIGLGGDTIEYKDNVLYINGKKQDEPWIKKHVEEEGLWMKDMYVEVPEGYCYVLGDNRDNSTDSRIFGSVPLSSVHGIKLNN